MSKAVTVLVIGSGGREHAIAWRLSQSPRVKRVIVAPGNPGMPEDWERWMVSFAEGKRDFVHLAKRAAAEKVDLVVVGPDDPLAAGIVDVFEDHEIACVGPSQGAAQIEASKAFGKEVMKAAGVSTAQYWAVDSQDEAAKLVRSLPWSKHWVVKADGLALGKGVQVCESQNDALRAVNELYSISGKLVIEEKLEGEELSWMAFCDGERCALMAPARDYKRVKEGNLGPNTGGMGAFSPVPGIREDHWERVEKEIFLPVLAEMKKRGTPFKGVLFAGLMFDAVKDRFWVLEFNARFGDPETQALLPKMEGDFYEWCNAVAQGDLTKFPKRVPFSSEHSVFVVAVSRGYPGKAETGFPISIGKAFQGRYFFSGVSLRNRDLINSGGRVLGALGLGPTRELAREMAYRQLSEVRFEGMQFRTDIGL